MNKVLLAAVVSLVLAGCASGGKLKHAPTADEALVKGGGGSFLGDLLLPLGFRGTVVIRAIDGKETPFSVMSGLPKEVAVKAGPHTIVALCTGTVDGSLSVSGRSTLEIDAVGGRVYQLVPRLGPGGTCTVEVQEPKKS
jgi:ABC-type Fe3+-hydroxamate transport system substrate-binding protein